MKTNATPTWPERRRAILALMGTQVKAVCVPERDRDLVIGLLEREGLLEPTGLGHHRLTSAGKVLRTLHAMERKESGPWRLSEMRVYAAVKQLDIDTCREALETLEARGLVAAHTTVRGIKWDLTTK